ncbi:MAG TPA: thioredoxin family protein [Oxalicibacterium sp.]
MSMNHKYASVEPAREDIDTLPGATVIEFGAPWCPHCQRVQPLLSDAFDAHPDLRHVKIEDGPRRRLGRSFRIKLWPTLVFLKNGSEISRLVRPDSTADIAQAMAAIDG